MTDQTIPADLSVEDVAHAREWARQMGQQVGLSLDDPLTPAAIRVIEALLPPPSRPTLADMNVTERSSMRWAQADVQGRRGRAVIIGTFWTNHTARVLWVNGEVTEEAGAAITPRPDLPSLTWPGDKPAPVPPSTLAVGSEWDDTDALARACSESGRDQIVVLDCDGYAFIWDEKAEWWEGSTPPQCAPYTILHTGKEDDQ